MIKVGLIGCGFMGGMHSACYKVLEPMGVKLVAVADVRPEFAQKVASEDTEIYACGMDLIEKADVDLIDICLPTHLHTAHAVAAMKKGRNVMIEKPVCFQDDEMELLMKTEKETGVKVQVGHCVRHALPNRWLKATVDSGVYGKIKHAEFYRLSGKPTWAWENWLHQVEKSGSVALDMHIHDVDLVRYIMGDPDTVKSQAQRDAEGAIQQISTVYGYGNNVSVSLEAGWDFPENFPFTSGWRVKFEKATAVMGGDKITVYTEDGEVLTPELVAEYNGTNNIGGNVSSLGSYYNELKYLIEGLQGKNDLSVAPITEAVASARLCKKEIAAAGGLRVK